MFDADYNFLERTLHWLALRCVGVAATSFDLDQATLRTSVADVVQQRHVFISGLARAGTTMLTLRFHATGQFRSLTYRDMPFVLAPNLWRQLSSISRRDVQRAERAHGDNVFVDTDSPESLEEVFWRIFAGRDYIKSHHLESHSPDEWLVGRYVRYVAAILATRDASPGRYLAKNNNNILRLRAISQAFPNALILIPFRDPLQHAHSLLRQHLRFSQMQATRRFVLSYMNWLGHHEFGLGHRPFRLDTEPIPAYPADTLEYWLQLWCNVYGWLERSRPSAAVFVSYEDLCLRPATWRRLADLAEISSPQAGDAPPRLSERPVSACCDRSLNDRAQALHARLMSHAGAQVVHE